MYCAFQRYELQTSLDDSFSFFVHLEDELFTSLQFAPIYHLSYSNIDQLGINLINLERALLSSRSLFDCCFSLSHSLSHTGGVPPGYNTFKMPVHSLQWNPGSG